VQQARANAADTQLEVGLYEEAVKFAFEVFSRANKASEAQVQRPVDVVREPVSHGDSELQRTVSSTDDRWVTAPTVVACNSTSCSSDSASSTASTTTSTGAAAAPQHMLKYKLQASSKNSAAKLETAVFFLAETLFSRVGSGPSRAYWQRQRRRDHVTSVDLYCNPETAAQYEVRTLYMHSLVYFTTSADDSCRSLSVYDLIKQRTVSVGGMKAILLHSAAASEVQ
jgi:hypothetical protein